MKEGTVFTVMILPRPWPPQVNLDLFLSEEGNFRFRLFADTEGRLILEMSSSEGVKMYRFQPLIVEGGGRAIIIIRWSSQEADLRLNGKPVLLDEHAKGESLTLQTKDEPFPSQDLIVGDVDLSATKSDVDRLFLGTVIDIDGRVQEVSWYNLIRAAGLLWQLFLDEYPLVHAVNRMYKQKLEFYTLDYTKRPPISPEFEWIGLDPSLFPDAKTMRNDLGDFLKAPCLISGGVTATVQDLIGACANAKGGRHLGKTRGPRKTERQSVIDWDAAVRLLGKEPSQVAIEGICRISLRGLLPLVNAITGSTACGS